MRRVLVPLLATAVAAGALFYVLGSSSSGSTPGATASVGDLRISGAYVPQPASPDVAVAYLTVQNTGATADRLVSASSPDAASVTAHETVTTSTGTMEMAALGPVVVPPHGRVAFSTGEKHLMVEAPKHALRQGDRLPLTLTFATAGRVTLQVPVTSIVGPQ